MKTMRWYVARPLARVCFWFSDQGRHFENTGIRLLRWGSKPHEYRNS